MREIRIVLPPFALLVACSLFNQKAWSDDEESAESSDGLYVTLPSEELARKHDGYPEDLYIGFGTYVRECGTCHPHVFLENLSSSEWHVMTPKMAWNTNISEREQRALLS